MEKEKSQALVYTTDFPFEKFSRLLPADLLEGCHLGVYTNHSTALIGIASLQAIGFDRVLYLCNTYWTGEEPNTDWLDEIKEVLELTPTDTQVRIVPFEPDFETVAADYHERMKSGKGVDALLGDGAGKEQGPDADGGRALEQGKLSLRRKLRLREAWKLSPEAGAVPGQESTAAPTREEDILRRLSQVRDVVSFFGEEAPGSGDQV